MSPGSSGRIVEAGRWLVIANVLAGIVAFYRYVFPANPTTVALTLLLLVLVLAAYWGLRYAVAASIVATALWNFFFLPPIGAFTIADPQNWVALLFFLGTSIFASHLSNRIRAEAAAAKAMGLERTAALEQSARAEAAQESERLRSALLDSVTHELRTPLTSIKASVSALLSQSALDADSRLDLLTVIDEESDRLNHLIQQAVEMAQLDTQKVQLDLQPHAAATLIDAAVLQTRSDYPGRAIVIALSHALPPVLADSAWIHKALSNLLENAVKYSAAPQNVTISAESRGAAVAISVADRGIGIDPSEQEKIFDKFYRGQSNRTLAQRHRVPGTGMGLAISRAIVEAHGGVISVSSHPDHGSVFTFTLPAASPLLP